MQQLAIELKDLAEIKAMEISTIVKTVIEEIPES